MSRSNIPESQRKSELGRVLLAAVLSIVLMQLWHYVTGYPESYQQRQKDTVQEIGIGESSEEDSQETTLDNLYNTDENQIPIKQEIYNQIAHGSRVQIKNNLLQGSINLRGARLDNMHLLGYNEDLHDDDAGAVSLLAPTNSKQPYHIEFSWLADSKSEGKKVEVPTSRAIWSSDSDCLTPGKTVTLSWKNKDDVLFEIILQMDDAYLLTATQRVTNSSDQEIRIRHYSMIVKEDTKQEPSFGGHQGSIGYLNDALQEISYATLRKNKQHPITQANGWCGVGDQYWMTVFLPLQDGSSKEYYHTYKAPKKSKGEAVEQFRVAVSDLGYTTVQSGSSLSNKTHLFVGAKDLDLIEKYKTQLQLQLFDRTVDFGFFHFITKPIFLLLNYINGMLQNMGISILLLTLIVRLLVYPLSHKGMQSAKRMKQLKPLMDEINEKHKGNTEEQSKAMFALYKKHGVNPFSGCLPLFFQIPVFIALYKVLSVSIEMRHASFLFIDDLSVPDPTSILNLFGLMPWEAPDFARLGILPIVTGLLLFAQQKIMPTNKQIQDNPAMKMFPFFFMIIATTLPAGLLIYSICGTIISIAQQMLITNRQQ